MTRVIIKWTFGLSVILSVVALFACNKDSNPPVITVLGANPIINCIIQLPDTVIYNEYIDEGAIATDAEDGDLTSDIITTSNVDIYQTGAYQVTYAVKDKAGNEAIATRSVFVQYCK